jgi:hypothetical protein
MGNITKHIMASHPREVVLAGALTIAARTPESSRSELLSLLLENHLPFSFADRPRVKAMFPETGGRGGLARYAAEMKTEVSAKLRADLESAWTCSIVMDEWTDAKAAAYVGAKVHCCWGHPVQYKTWSLGHSPLDDTHAESIAPVALKLLDEFRIRDRVAFVVTDTANVMKALTRVMEKCWAPCWAHVLHLLLGDSVDAMRPHGLSWIIEIASGPISSSLPQYPVIARLDGIR